MPRRRKKGPLTSEQVKKNAERTYRHFMPQTIMEKLGMMLKPEYCYVYGITPGGKTVFWGPLPPDEAEAAAKGLVDGEVFDLTTKDIHKATGEIKAELLKRGKAPDSVLQRMSHIRIK